MKKQAYPIILSKGNDYIVVYIPDFNINTQGADFAEAIEMARDAIGIIGIDMQDEHEPIPTPTDIKNNKYEFENTNGVGSADEYIKSILMLNSQADNFAK